MCYALQMLQSDLFTRVGHTAPKDEEATNAKLLIRAGFIDKTMAGVYSFLPLGLRVLSKIETIVREEMNALGGQELLMPALQPKELWETTGRWTTLDALFRVVSHFKQEYALGPTHEEVVVPLVQSHLFSYNDLPCAVYQIQTKFRDEARSKSGLLRGREFRMKDLYSFHASAEDLEGYYEKVKACYTKLFKRLGLQTLIVEASGGTFSKFSHEFQVLSEAGEDMVYHCACGFARNKEIIDGELQKIGLGEKGKCSSCGGELRVDAGIEVGNIFLLKTKYSEPFGLRYKDESGKEQTVLMGCYGIGTTRAMGAIVETSHDEKGMLWPVAVAPFRVHLLELGGAPAKEVYRALTKQGIEVLYDDRDMSAGEKLVEADLLGIPWRMVVSLKTGEKVELKARKDKEGSVVELKQAIASIQ